MATRRETLRIQLKPATALAAIAGLMLLGCQMPESLTTSKKAIQSAPSSFEEPTGRKTLTWVTIDPSGLGGKPAIIIPEAGSAFQDPTAFAIPDGAYSLRTRNGNGLYGEFTLAAGKITRVTGALVATSDGVKFDISKLNQVTIDSGILSFPEGVQSIILSDLGQVVSGKETLYIPSGTYSVMTREGHRTFGWFTVQGGRIVDTRDAVVGAGNDVSFDLSRLTGVTVDPSELSIPTGSQVVILQELGASFRTATTFHLPDGPYLVQTRTGAQTFGSFNVLGGKIVSTSGAILTSGLTLFFDVVALGSALLN